MGNSQDAVYAGYTLEALGRQYDIEATVPDVGVYLRRYAEASQAVRAKRRARLDVPYGDGPGETLDAFLPDAGHAAPVIVFIHGGGWRGSNKESRAFPADLFCPAGAVWISIEYPLAPAHSLDQMVSAVRKAIAWVKDNAADFGGDASRIVVVGNSAGGHLAAMAATGESGGKLVGLVTISGVFDMKPLQLTHANGWLRMDDAGMLRNSPIRHIPANPCLLVAFAGEHEPDEFKRQSRDFAEAWRGAGAPARFAEVAGHNHFSIIGLVGERDNEVGQAILELVKLG